MAVRFIDEHPAGFGWIHPEPASMERASHALLAGGRVALVDPTDDPGLDARVRALGEPGCVIQLLDRHNRDGAAIAARLGIPLLRVPDAAVPGFPFQVVPVVDVPGWHERALWWPEQRLLVVSESLGTAAYYRAPGERLAVHPVRRLLPPRGLAGYDAEWLLVGHGAGVSSGAADAVREAVSRAVARTPAWASARVGEVIGRARARGGAA